MNNSQRLYLDKIWCEMLVLKLFGTQKIFVTNTDINFQRIAISNISILQRGKKENYFDELENTTTNFTVS